MNVTGSEEGEMWAWASRKEHESAGGSGSMPEGTSAGMGENGIKERYMPIKFSIFLIG